MVRVQASWSPSDQSARLRNDQVREPNIQEVHLPNTEQPRLYRRGGPQGGELPRRARCDHRPRDVGPRPYDYAGKRAQASRADERRDAGVAEEPAVRTGRRGLIQAKETFAARTPAAAERTSVSGLNIRSAIRLDLPLPPERRQAALAVALRLYRSDGSPRDRPERA